MTLRVLYLHGLGSSGNSSTVSNLRQALKLRSDEDVELIAPTYNPESATAWRNFIDIADEVDVVVGTSLGGYHALQLAAHNIIASYVVINPCYNPREMLRKYVGQELPNYCEPDAMADRFTDYERRQFQAVDMPAAPHQPITWIIGGNDDLIDPAGQQDFAEQIGCCIIDTDWGHRVEDADQLADIVMSASIPSGI